MVQRTTYIYQSHLHIEVVTPNMELGSQYLFSFLLFSKKVRCQ